jgi:hypothetical protein
MPCLGLLLASCGMEVVEWIVMHHSLAGGLSCGVETCFLLFDGLDDNIVILCDSSL